MKLYSSFFFGIFQLIYTGQTFVDTSSCVESLKDLTKILKLKPIAVSVVDHEHERPREEPVLVDDPLVKKF